MVPSIAARAGRGSTPADIRSGNDVQRNTRRELEARRQFFRGGDATVVIDDEHLVEPELLRELAPVRRSGNEERDAARIRERTVAMHDGHRSETARRSTGA